MLVFCIIASVVIATSVNGSHILQHLKKLKDDWREPEVPPWKTFRKITQQWITQPLDHFNKRDNRTWQMRFYENDMYHRENGPTFIMLGGEWEIDPSFLLVGFLHNLARDVNARMFYTEHRYYGQSKPTEDKTTANLQYLSVDQALADVAYFIDVQKKEKNLGNASVVVFGGSYSANMAVWMRLKYPHLVQGALASSAPVYAKADFYEYLEVVSASLARYNEQCVTDSKTAVYSMMKLLFEENGPEKLIPMFKLCSAPDASLPNDVGLFVSIFTELFSEIVQYDRPVKNSSLIGELCNYMTDENFGSPLERLSKVVRESSIGCNEVNYWNMIKDLQETRWSENKNPTRQWLYQTCTEYGYYQTTNSDASIFGSLLGLDFYVNLCKDLFGEYFDDKILHASVRRTNIMYGGRTPDVTNVIFVNGKIDPWHALSVLQNLNDQTHAFLIDDTSHCADLKEDKYGDSEGLKETRKRNREIIKSWI